MPQSTVKLPENAESLRHAWYAFMALHREEAGYRKRFNEMRRPKPDETREETDQRITRIEIKERNWKWDLLSEIRDGKFWVYGRDISNEIDAPISMIPNAIFDEQNSHVSIDWDRNYVEAYGKTIIEIHVAPKILTNPKASEIPAAVAAAPVDVLPAKPGATSFESERRRTIIACYEREPNFNKWKISKRIEYAKRVADELFPGLGFGEKHSNGFSRSAFYETVKYLKQTGLLPSNNVQN